MSRPAGRRALVARVVDANRVVVLVLAVLLLLNVLAYAFVVYPLARRVSTVAERTQAAETELVAARALQGRATATLTGKASATDALEIFYGQVLPADLASARRVAYPRLEQLARQTNLRAVNTRLTPADDNGAVALLRINMDLEGSYASVRRFLDALERMSEFLVIDQVALSEAPGAENGVNVRLELSTYYRNTPVHD